MSKIILFTGGGIGVPVGLPTTTDFVSTITKIRDNNPILKYVFEYLGKSSNDIEKLLFTLEELNREDNSTFKIIKNVVTEGNLPETVKIMENISSFNSQVKNAIDSIKKEIFNKLNNFNRIKAFSLYYNLFKEITTAVPGYKLSFSTTNYDLTFDDAFQSDTAKWDDIGIKKINDFFVEDRGRFILKTGFRKDNDDDMTFVKIHGSLNWHYDSGKNITKSGGVTTPDDPNTMPLIYPGFKGFIEDEPFKAFHDHLAADLDKAYAAIFIGFAFRDQYINFMLENALRRRQAKKNALFVQCFNPARIDEYPSNSRLPYFAKEFKDMFFLYNESFEVKENPLSIIGKALHQKLR
ncbi:MAG: SIR2 family protein [Thermodesulfobacteriota bacterium]|jgi:hypothetical protein